MIRNVTLAEVAREAGVSPSTVSRILNGTARVKGDKEQSVRRAIDLLGYRPNAFARGLATGASGSIGVLTQDIASPFYNDALSGIERGLMGSGYSPIIISGHWRTDEEEHAVELLLARRVEALIVLGGQLPDQELRDLAARLPVAVLGRPLDLSEYGGASLALNNRQASRDLVTHLLDRGHRVIGHIMGLADQEDAQERLGGYRDALESRGVAYVPSLVVQGDFREPSGLIGMQRLLAAHPDITAAFCANDQMAYGARLALYRLGIRVPEDVSLVGFDDLPGSCYTTPPLTSVRQPMEEMGQWLARFVLGRLLGEDVPAFNPRLELQLRESVASRRP
ncbi:LacI family DNA-binding transcriptional regulator [uncultured Deinococcus sp.]|uniref:LacI family DNA-binding transcriptional regulator n=1 Tax=uncultured Deinococcus sp. TaxID=158789 RepID=UPI00258F4F18|nr:LacI family DNA-binding transcriptional regulator [uncultured Deinococcus sp.]